MILLDTDHLSVLTYVGNRQYDSLSSKIRESTEEFGATIVSLEEQMRGWLAAIHGKSDVGEQIAPYAHLARLWDFYRDWRILPWDAKAVALFKGFRKQKVRIGTQDLKIAAIALANDALLLSANLRDFQKVAGLRVENWSA
jgi:tRNA(fMet)-specific endonuclease VapC